MSTNFTSPWISQASLGSWDYYVFSDNDGFRMALNGLAAWFGSNGPLMQNAALFGGLVLLAIALYGMATQKMKINAGVIGAWAFFAATIGMTTKVNVINMYTGAVVVVDNVPALVTIPASTFSKAAYKVFETTETAFQSTGGSYMTVKANGFAGPLNILLSLRTPRLASVVTPEGFKTLHQSITDCAIDPNSSFGLQLNQSTDLLNYLAVNGRKTGLTTIFKPGVQDGESATCGDAFSYLDTLFNSTVSGNSAGGSQLISMVNSVATSGNPNNPNGNWTSADLLGAKSFLENSVSPMSQTAEEMTKNSLVLGIANNAMRCLSETNSLAAPNNCGMAAYTISDAQERWKTNATAGGQGFLKTMFTSMSFLQIMFFMLFPFITIYGLAVGTNITKVFMGYIFFGIWSQSWLLVVAPIQLYIQNSVASEISRVASLPNGVRGMTMANYAEWYDVLVTKLAIASDLLSSAQSFTLMLLSGTAIAASSMADRWSGKNAVQSTDMFKDHWKPDAMHSGVSGVSHKTIQGPGGATLGTTQTNNAANTAISTAVVQNSTQSKNTGVDFSRVMSKGDGLSIKREDGSSLSFSKAETKSAVEAANATVGGSAGISSKAVQAFGSGINNLFKAKGHNATPEQQQKMNQMGEAALQKATTDLSKEDKNFAQKLMSSNMDEKMAAWDKLLDTAFTVATVAEIGIATFGTGGAGVVAAPEIAVLNQGAKAATKTGVRSYFASHKGDAIATAEKVAQGARGTSDFVGSFSDGAKAMATTAFQNKLENSDTFKAEKQRSDDSKVGRVSDESLKKQISNAYKESAGESTSVGKTSTVQTSLDYNSLAGIFANDPAKRANTDTNLRIMKSGKTQEQIAKAEHEVSTMLHGWSGDNAAVDQAIRNTYMQHALTGMVNWSPSLGQGASSSNIDLDESKVGGVNATVQQGNYTLSGNPGQGFNNQSYTNASNFLSGGAKGLDARYDNHNVGNIAATQDGQVRIAGGVEDGKTKTIAAMAAVTVVDAVAGAMDHNAKDKERAAKDAKEAAKESHGDKPSALTGGSHDANTGIPSAQQTQSQPSQNQGSTSSGGQQPGGSSANSTPSSTSPGSGNGDKLSASTGGSHDVNTGIPSVQQTQSQPSQNQGSTSSGVQQPGGSSTNSTPSAASPGSGNDTTKENKPKRGKRGR